MEEDREFRMQLDMQIADGQLEGVPQASVFVYGVEFGMAMFLTQVRFEEHTMNVHPENAKRIVDALESQGMGVMQRWINDDWIELTIHPPPE